MMNSNTQKHNCTIDICRYLCAILVVAIHTEPFSDINPHLAFGVKHILGRIAVPFFFAVSGYYYAGKLYNNKRPFFPYIKRLLNVFLGWFLIYFIVDLIQHGLSSPLSFSFNAFKGLFFQISPSHFWYFPALIYCVCMFTLLQKIGINKLLFPLTFIFVILGVLGGSLLEIGQRIPLLNRLYLHHNYDLLRKYLLMAPSYFLLGTLICKTSRQFLPFSDRSILGGWIFSVILWGVEIVSIKYIADRQLYTGMSLGLYICTFFTLVLALRHPLTHLEKLSGYCKVLANFTYYSHILFINLINQFTWKILKIDLTDTQMFYTCVFLTGFVGLLLFKWNHKRLNALIR